MLARLFCMTVYQCEKFFDNVPQDKLMSYVGRVIHDGDTEISQSACNYGRLIRSNRNRHTARRNLSSLLSSIILNELDKGLESRGLRFTRYADYMVIVLKSRVAATRVMYSITDWIDTLSACGHK